MQARTPVSKIIALCTSCLCTLMVSCGALQIQAEPQDPDSLEYASERLRGEREARSSLKIMSSVPHVCKSKRRKHLCTADPNLRLHNM